MPEICLIIHDIRSTHNVGSLLRTAEGLGVSRVYFTGYTPYPKTLVDERLPHISKKLTSQIHKTALGAEDLVQWQVHDDILQLIGELKTAGYRIVGLEQSARASRLPDYHSPSKIVLLIGREVEGLALDLQNICDDLIEIPMYGQKESFNVVQAAAIALYTLRES